MNPPMDSSTLQMRLSANPHNLPGIAGAPPLSPHNYWIARFEREGAQAEKGAPNPYNAGTMAATRWQSGKAWREISDLTGVPLIFDQQGGAFNGN